MQFSEFKLDLLFYKKKVVIFYLENNSTRTNPDFVRFVIK